MDACTIIARNYLPHARVLAASFLEHHPGGNFTALIVDDPGRGSHSSEPFAALSPYDIGLDPTEVHRMAFIYDVKEFSTALKPFLLRHLLEDARDVTYFDPDIEIFDALEDVSTMARRHGIVLTPHTLEALPRDDLLPSEKMVLQAGIYNLGFISVGGTAAPFLDWWAERLSRDCVVAVEDGVFVDQRWVDFVPALFEPQILRDPGCNVAYWNLSSRHVTWTGERYEVNGRPLRFYHYSGFSPDRMHVLSSHMGTMPRSLLADFPAVQRLCETYAMRLRTVGFGRHGATRYRFDMLPGGLRIDGAMRRGVREALVVSERAGQETAPDPFDPDEEDTFFRWLAEPTGPAGLPRYLQAVHRRRWDLRQMFPDIEASDRDAYVSWARTAGSDADRLLGEVLRHAPDTHDLEHGTTGHQRRLIRRARFPFGARRYDDVQDLVVVPGFPPLPGVNVAGYLRAELGVGEAARRVTRGLEAGGIPHSTITYRRTDSRQQHAFREDVGVAPYDVNLVCVNADELPKFRADAGPRFFSDRYTIGFWFWEVSRFPRELQRSFELVDEVWVASDFVAEAIASETAKPVHVLKLPVEAARPTDITRTDLGLPEGFVFLFSFDFLSVLERKNPLGLIDAFERAFDENEGPTLVIKTINGDKETDSLARLRRRAASRSDVLVRDGYLSPSERDALVSLCDSYVSLHRSEGYGLTMAEAMAAAKPVIATGFSGNLAFMSPENSLLVPYRRTPVPRGCDPYPTTAEWAEPDIDAAAEMMRDVWASPTDARELGRRGQVDVLWRNAPERTGDLIAQRLFEIRTTSERYDLLRSQQPMPGASLLDTGRAPTRIARRLLHRLLWPYLVEQQAFAMAVAEALKAQEALRFRGPRSSALARPGSEEQESPTARAQGLADLEVALAKQSPSTGSERTSQ